MGGHDAKKEDAKVSPLVSGLIGKQRVVTMQAALSALLRFHARTPQSF